MAYLFMPPPPPPKRPAKKMLGSADISIEFRDLASSRLNEMRQMLRDQPEPRPFRDPLPSEKKAT